MRAKPGSDQQPRELHVFFFEIRARGPDSLVTESVTKTVFSSVHGSKATKGEIAALERVNARAGRMLADMGGELQSPLP